MESIEAIRKFFNKDKFATDMGAEIDWVKDGCAGCSLTIADGHKNAGGSVQGGAIFTLADFAFAVAVNWKQLDTVSLHSDIAYLGAARGDRLTAEAICIKEGKTTSYYRIEVKDAEDRLVAVVNTTGYRQSAGTAVSGAGER